MLIFYNSIGWLNMAYTLKTFDTMNTRSLDEVFQTIQELAPELKATLQNDHFSVKKYITIENLKAVTKIPALTDFMKTLFQGTPPIAKIGDDVSIRLDDEASALIIFRDVKLHEVRQKLFDDYTMYTHRHAFKVAEFHGFTGVAKLTDNEPGEYRHFGGAVIPKGAVSGRFYIRTDDYYNIRYFKGFQKLKPGELYPKADKGSLSVEFDITEAQARTYFDKIKSDDIKTRENYTKFAFYLPHTIRSPEYLGKNCYDYGNEIFRALGFNGTYFDYIKIDEVNVKDQGVMFQWMDYSRTDFFANFPLVWEVAIAPYTSIPTSIITLLSYFQWFAPFSNIHPLSSKETFLYTNSADLQKVNELGETKLHVALLAHKFDLAKEFLNNGINVDAQNKANISALGLAAGLPASQEKYAILKEMIARTQNINLPEIDGTAIPLTKAVLANDLEAVRMILLAGGDFNFRNDNGDNLVHLATQNNAYDVVYELYRANPSLMIEDNGEHQYPVALVCNNEAYNQSLFTNICNEYNMALYNKTFDELYHRVPADLEF